MTNSEKAKKVIRILSWHLDDASVKVAKMHAQEASRATYDRVYRKFKEEADRDNIGMGSVDQEYKMSDFDQQKLTKAEEELEIYKEVYDYAIEIFLNKLD